MSAEELLAEKTAECESIQKAFDEYVDSSKELENELEITLAEAEEKLAELAKKKAISDEKSKDLQEKLAQMTKECSKSQNDFIIAKENENKLIQLTKELEITNEDLSNKVRMLEATEENLKHKLQNLEEDIVFLQGDLHDLDAVKVETEDKLKEEMLAMQAELESLRANKSKSDDSAESRTGGSETTNAELLQRIDELQLELDEVNAHATEFEAQKNDLLEELTKVTDELIAAQETIQAAENMEQKEQLAQLEREVEFLKSQNDLKNETIQDLLKGAESTELRDMAVQIDEKNAELAELRGQIESYIDISNAEKQELVAEMSEKMMGMADQIAALTAELETTKAALVTATAAAAATAASNVVITTVAEPAAVVMAAKPNEIDAPTKAVPAAPRSSKASLAVATAAPPLTKEALVSTSSGLAVRVNALIATGDAPKINAELLRMVGEYEAIRRSNARLLGKLQAVQGNIQVCCRTRPPSESELGKGKICIDAADDTELMCYDSRMETWKTFMFDRVWRADATQADVFSDVEPMVSGAVEGYNVCIMAYGQTGSGKTFTMDGSGDKFGVSYRTIQKLFDMLNFRKAQETRSDSRQTNGTSSSQNSALPPKLTKPTGPTTASNKVTGAHKKTHSRGGSFEMSNPLMGKNSPLSTTGSVSTDTADGISPAGASPAVRSIDGVAAGIAAIDVTESEDPLQAGNDEEGESGNGFSFSVEISMMEIYNEQVYDLLHESSGGGQSDGVSLDIRQGTDNVISVPGLKSVQVSCIEEVMEVFAKGATNRATSSTNLNEHSSRSHLIILVEVTTKVGEELALKGKLHLVDLAGSERVGKSGVTGAAMKEAQYINKSLSALGDVMEALDQKSKHVPYRNSKLTYLLQNSLGGNSRTMMIVTVCPTDLTFDESLFTLQFATRVRNISTGPAQKNSNAKNLEESLKAAKREIQEAKKKRLQLEEAVAEGKRELKKVSEKMAVPETKVKTLEEAKRAAEVLLQQTTRQLNETASALALEKSSKEQTANDLELTQRNLKKALESAKEQLRENERMATVSKAKDKENADLKLQITKLETAITVANDKVAKAVAAAAATAASNLSPVDKKLSSPMKILTYGASEKSSSPSPTPSSSSSFSSSAAAATGKASASELMPPPQFGTTVSAPKSAPPSVTPIVAAAGPATSCAPVLSTPVGSAVKAPSGEGTPKDVNLSPMLKANSFRGFPSDLLSNTSSLNNASSSNLRRSMLGSYAQSTASSIQRTTVMGPPQVTGSSASKSSGGSALEGGASRVHRERVHSLSSIPMRPRASLSASSGVRSPQRSGSSDNQHNTPVSAVPHSAEKNHVSMAALSAASLAASTKAPALSARSEEALKRHQARMEKKRAEDEKKKEVPT